MNNLINNYLQNLIKLHNINIPQILNYDWFQLFKQQIFFKYKRYNALFQSTHNNILYIQNKYTEIFNINKIQLSSNNVMNFKNIHNIISFNDLLKQISDKNIKKKFKEKINLLKAINKKIIIFNIDYLIKNKQFNSIFNQYLNKKKFNLSALYEATDCINCRSLLYSKFFNYFFNFIIYKAQVQQNQKFGFNSLMSIKNSYKIQSEDLNELYIYVHKDLGQQQLNKQLSYIINKILEN